MKQLKRKLSFLLIAVMVLTMNVQIVHATEPGNNPTEVEGENQDGNVTTPEDDQNDTTPPETDGSTDSEAQKPEDGTTEPGNNQNTDDTDSEAEAPKQNQDETALNKPHTIKIYGVGEGHTYEAYKIFQGRVDTDENGTEILSDIQWGSGINTEEIDELMNDLRACTAAGIDGEDYPFKDCTTPAGVAEVLSKSNSDSELLVAFSRIVGKHLSNTYFTSKEPTKQADETYTYEIDVTGDGYYFVKDKDGSLETEEGESYTKYILEVVGDVNVKAKADTPQIDKEIVECEGHEPGEPHTPECAGTDKNNAAIGDIVNFKLTSKVPAMDGYDNYWFNILDTLSEGLTFNDDVKIVITGPGLTAPIELTRTYDVSDKGQTFTVTTGTAIDGKPVSGTAVEIILKNFIQYKDIAGASIEITYSATLNENAELGNGGNKNTVKLIYSNNPQYPSGGDRPDPDEPKGETPEDETFTYVTAIDLTKVTGQGEEEERLTGAEFEITGTKINTVLVRRDVFEEDANGTYYKLKKGEYTQDPPTDQTAASYASITTKYTKKEQLVKASSSAGIRAVGTVGEDGVLRFEGLAAGEYVITELKAPDGYNKLSSPITITISWEKDESDLTKCKWTVTGEGAKVDSDGRITLRVENNKGTTLPSTGGMGTTIFYAVGSILVLGAAIILIAKKRANVEK